MTRGRAVGELAGKRGLDISLMGSAAALHGHRVHPLHGANYVARSPSLPGAPRAAGTGFVSTENAGPAKHDSSVLFVLNGYAFIKIIGRGGQSTVYLVRSLRYGEVFAAKIIERVTVADMRDHAEVKAMQHLSHPGVVRCYDVFLDRGRLVIVYEYCKGGTLTALIKENPQGLSEISFREIAGQLVRALAFVHSQGLAHGDVKVCNILFADAERRRVKLADFGLCRPARRMRIRASGTPMFQAREIWLGDEFCPMAADVWSLGVTFCCMLGGDCPWQGETDDEKIRHIVSCDFSLRRELPQFEAVLRRMIVREDLRITTAELAALHVFASPAHAPARILPSLSMAFAPRCHGRACRIGAGHEAKDQDHASSVGRRRVLPVLMGEDLDEGN